MLTSDLKADPPAAAGCLHTRSRLISKLTDQSQPYAGLQRLAPVASWALRLVRALWALRFAGGLCGLCVSPEGSVAVVGGARGLTRPPATAQRRRYCSIVRAGGRASGVTVWRPHRSAHYHYVVSIGTAGLTRSLNARPMRLVVLKGSLDWDVLWSTPFRPSTLSRGLFARFLRAL